MRQHKKHKPRTKYTKNGALRQGKAIGTKRTHWLRSQIWRKVKIDLQNHIARAPVGTMRRLASHLGLHQSQIHRFICPKCEHNQEPSFSVGLAIMLYLERRKAFKVATFRHAVFQPKKKPISKR